MYKRNEQLQADRYSLLDCEIRPVKETDKWCRHGLSPVEDDAPWGYVVTIPYVPNLSMILENVDGHIIRVKKHCGKLLLQVVKKNFAPKYGIKSYEGYEANVGKKRRKKKNNRILNIRNFRKSEGKW